VLSVSLLLVLEYTII